MWSGKVTYSRSLRHSTLQICSIKRLHDCGPLIINMDMALPWISSIGIFSYFLLRYECKCKTFNNSILGAGLFKRSAPSGFTSSPLKEEISLYSIIRSKWFERVIFPPPSSCHPKCGRKWEWNKSPTPWLRCWFLSRRRRRLQNKIAGRITLCFPNDTGTIITLEK